MRRARHPVPSQLANLRLGLNIKTGFYEVEENGILYCMPLEETRLLKVYFKANQNGTIQEWYNKLSKATKKRVNRIGNMIYDNEGFYPDNDFES